MREEIFLTDYVEEDTTNFFLKKLRYYNSRRKFYYKSCNMRGDYFGTVDLLPFVDDGFFIHLDRVKKKVEKAASRALTYYYFHMLDYKKGGDMLIHNHQHSEDYTSLLYLNDSTDGSTFFIEGDKKYEVLPEKNKLIMYPSYVDHGSNYSTSKKVAVFGFHFKYKFLS